MQVHRSNARGNQKEPKSYDEIFLDDECLKMNDGSNFLLRKGFSKQSLLLFNSEKGRESVKHVKIFFMEGTFNSCSKQFAQINFIHSHFESRNEETNVFPV